MSIQRHPAEQIPEFRRYAAQHPMLSATVKAGLEKRRSELLEQLMNAADWGDYSRRRGLIMGIDEAIQFTITAETQLDQRR